MSENQQQFIYYLTDSDEVKLRVLRRLSSFYHFDIKVVRTIADFEECIITEKDVIFLSSGFQKSFAKISSSYPPEKIFSMSIMNQQNIENSNYSLFFSTIESEYETIVFKFAMECYFGRLKHNNKLAPQGYWGNLKMTQWDSMTNIPNIQNLKSISTVKKAAKKIEETFSHFHIKNQFHITLSPKYSLLQIDVDLDHGVFSNFKNIDKIISGLEYSSYCSKYLEELNQWHIVLSFNHLQEVQNLQNKLKVELNIDQLQILSKKNKLKTG